MTVSTPEQETTLTANGSGRFPSPPPLNGRPDTQSRYRRILIFFARIIAHLVLWDVLGGRVPILRQWVWRTRPERFRQWARRFRAVAVEMGGVMIKLGQFLSARVDVLPPEITEELKGLQDEVPPVPSAAIFQILRAELGDLSRRFAYIEPEPLAAASLGQAHRAWLRPANGTTERGEAVVLKVQRPSIEEIVGVDLDALRLVARWVMYYPPIRRRADAPALMEEFARTLWEELDYEAEADNAEQFAIMFANNERVYIPAVYRQHSTGRVLALEDVEAIKITDIEGMAAVGIDSVEVADALFDAYFHQIFRQGFFHADPHPGNLFVKPRTDLAWTEGDEGGRPFWLIFVDFGMVGRVADLMGDNLRKVLISVTQRDARQLTEAYNNLGFFLPGADLERIIEAQDTVLNRIWGRNLLELARPDPHEVQELGKEFRDLLFDFPFQVPQDFIYLGRALGMMSGLVSLLDPQINPWYKIEHYGLELIQQQTTQALSWATAVDLIKPYLTTPARIQRLLEAAESGRLQVQNKADRDTLRRLDRLEKRIGQLSWSILGAAGMITAVLWWRRKSEE
jgi:predicted unusual protein kinase regulating ubiquinone biosynthesis (AarF/ABC1/UbiB family)